MTYSAIWKTHVSVNSSQLLEEFEQAMAGQLRQIYPKNESWTGVMVLEGKTLDFTSSLPHLSKLLNTVGRERVLGAIYFNLAADSNLHRHRDMNGNLLFGVMRLHIPLKTNPQAIIEVKRIPYHLPLNTVWALDTSAEHALRNTSQDNRIHLVLDIKYSPETAIFFPKITLSVLWHLCVFFCIMLSKIVRDLFTKPKSLLDRIHSLKGKR